MFLDQEALESTLAGQSIQALTETKLTTGLLRLEPGNLLLLPLVGTITRTPADLPTTVAAVDCVAHYLGHAIEDAESGQALRGLPVPLALAPVPLQMTRDILGSVLDLLESGSLILWQTDDEDGFTSFALAIPTVN